MKRLFPLALLLALLPASCAEEAESYYANLRAFFRFGSVITTPQLNSAVNNPGQFCTITFSGGYYLFTGPDGSFTRYAATAVDNYGRPEYVSGFIVGTPAVPDLNGNFALSAFDLVCPNCYETYIQRPLSFSGTTAMHCNRCGRTYDLNNGGIVSSGTAGRPLFRYRVTYAATQGMLLIQN